MRLQRAILMAIIALFYHFAVGVVGTLFPGIFRNLVAAQSIQILSLLASAVPIYFLMVFLRDYLFDEQQELKQATILAVIGQAGMVLLYVRGLFQLFSNLRVSLYTMSPGLSNLVASSSEGAIGPVVAWGSALLYLVFFAKFYRVTLAGEQTRLARAILAGISSAFISVLIRSTILVGITLQGQTRWWSDMPRHAQTWLLPVSACAFAAMLYFYLIFYREQRSRAAPAEVE